MKLGLTDFERDQKKKLAARKEKIIFALWPRQVMDGSYRVFENVLRVKRWEQTWQRYYTFYHVVPKENKKED